MDMIYTKSNSLNMKFLSGQVLTTAAPAEIDKMIKVVEKAVLRTNIINQVYGAYAPGAESPHTIPLMVYSKDKAGKLKVFRSSTTIHLRTYVTT
ncbi:hypothetical protein D5071_09425 [Pectobacterium carotovorum]|uniref:Uncharacterized protein n=1 Tax=Pectobacterium carotovorum TaxID=554 RepID=A0A419AX48_PECCA|nr:hypothetical protein D5071_09425 [Pectobacterium carotovorum]